MSSKTRWAVLFLLLALFAFLLRSCYSPGNSSLREDLPGRPGVDGSIQENKAQDGEQLGSEGPRESDRAGPKNEDLALAKLGTLFAIVRVTSKGVRLEHQIAKATLPYRQSRTGRARFRLQDPASDRVLATGPCPWPRLCQCPLKSDHRVGCVPTRHAAVIRLKLPLLSRGVLVRIETLNGGIWTEAGRFQIEE